ncbi:hypothetical protein [Mycoplasma hafezii]|uniref:hypothetical protein n=1 Tax=Mycoplasma hafezii TaxID=525886 RepID=UPI003CED8D20
MHLFNLIKLKKSELNNLIIKQNLETISFAKKADDTKEWNYKILLTLTLQFLFFGLLFYLIFLPIVPLVKIATDFKITFNLYVAILILAAICSFIWMIVKSAFSFAIVLLSKQVLKKVDAYMEQTTDIKLKEYLEDLLNQTERSVRTIDLLEYTDKFNFNKVSQLLTELDNFCNLGIQSIYENIRFKYINVWIRISLFFLILFFFLDILATLDFKFDFLKLGLKASLHVGLIIVVLFILFANSKKNKAIKKAIDILISIFIEKRTDQFLFYKINHYQKYINYYQKLNDKKLIDQKYLILIFSEVNLLQDARFVKSLNKYSTNIKIDILNKQVQIIENILMNKQ